MMKPGLAVGHQENVTITVTDEMVAAFEGKIVHPTLSTVTMVYYMEWVGRKVILPFLELDEEGVGGAISVKHCAPAPVGKTVTFTATATEVKPNKVICHVTAHHELAMVGEGEFTQVILSRQLIQERIESMR